MRFCSFFGCDRFPHTGPHTYWDSERGESVPLKEQRTHAEIAGEAKYKALREKADRIASQVMDAQHFRDYQTASGEEVRAWLTEAALQALTEKES